MAKNGKFGVAKFREHRYSLSADRFPFSQEAHVRERLGATLLREAAKAFDGQRTQMRQFFAVQLEHLSLLPTMNARRRPELLPMGQPYILRLDRVEAFAFEGGEQELIRTPEAA